MENNMLETRMNNMEGILGKLSIVTQQSMKGQEIISGLIEEISTNLSMQINEEIEGIKIGMSGEIVGIKGEIEVIKDTMNNEEISGEQISGIEKERRKRVIHLLGGKKSDRYAVFSNEYFKNIGYSIKKYFSQGESPLSAFKYIKKNQYDDVIDFIHSWKPNGNEIKHKVIEEMLILKDKTEDLEFKINKGNLKESEKQYLSHEMYDNKKKLKAFNKYMNKESKVL